MRIQQHTRRRDWTDFSVGTFRVVNTDDTIIIETGDPTTFRVTITRNELAHLIRNATTMTQEHFAATLRVIDHHQQRYDTCGDWRLWPKLTDVSVSSLPDRRYEFLVAIHELIEAELCRHRGITEAEVTDWDTVKFRDSRNPYMAETDEPGDDPAAPYHREHMFASKIERLLADELSVVWADYEVAIEKLSP